jgi:hypothetical protein
MVGRKMTERRRWFAWRDPTLRKDWTTGRQRAYKVLRMFPFIQQIAGAVKQCAGIARVPRALVGVPPTRSSEAIPRRLARVARGRSHRWDADGGDRDGRDPHSQMQRAGLERVRAGLAFAPCEGKLFHTVLRKVLSG